MKKWMIAVCAGILLIVVLLSVLVCRSQAGSVVSIDGDVALDIMPQKLMEKAELGDTVTVMCGGLRQAMPFTDEIITEDGTVQLLLDRENWCIRLYQYQGGVAEEYNIDVGDRILIRG